VIEVYDLLNAISTNESAFPDFSFAQKISEIVDGILLSADEGRWVTLAEIRADAAPVELRS